MGGELTQPTRANATHGTKNFIFDFSVISFQDCPTATRQTCRFFKGPHIPRRRGVNGQAVKIFLRTIGVMKRKA